MSMTNTLVTVKLGLLGLTSDSRTTITQSGCRFAQICKGLPCQLSLPFSCWPLLYCNQYVGHDHSCVEFAILINKYHSPRQQTVALESSVERSQSCLGLKILFSGFLYVYFEGLLLKLAKTGTGQRFLDHMSNKAKAAAVAPLVWFPQ